MAAGLKGFAEFACADWGRVNAFPMESMSMAAAATLPIALQTMHNALITQAGLCTGQDVLVVGAGSGVGLMGVIMARALGADKVFATSTSAERRAQLLSFGADLAVDTSEPGWSGKILAATGGKGVDATIDMVSGNTVNDSLAATKVCGTIVNVGRLGGGAVNFDAELHALRRLRYIGVTFRTRSVEEVRVINELMQADLGGLLREGKLRLPFVKHPFAKVREALDTMSANKHFGKIVLEM
jgi:NADPH2:quinone reductase